MEDYTNPLSFEDKSIECGGVEEVPYGGKMLFLTINSKEEDNIIRSVEVYLTPMELVSALKQIIEHWEVV